MAAPNPTPPHTPVSQSPTPTAGIQNYRRIVTYIVVIGKSYPFSMRVAASLDFAGGRASTIAPAFQPTGYSLSRALYARQPPSVEHVPSSLHYSPFPVDPPQCPGPHSHRLPWRPPDLAQSKTSKSRKRAKHGNHGASLISLLKRRSHFNSGERRLLNRWMPTLISPTGILAPAASHPRSLRLFALAAAV